MNNFNLNLENLTILKKISAIKEYIDNENEDSPLE